MVLLYLLSLLQNANCSSVCMRRVIAGHLEARFTLGTLRPGNERIPVFAFALLPVADLVPFLYGWHGRVVGPAHDILAEDVEAVVDVVLVDELFFAGVRDEELVVGVADVFLDVGVSMWLRRCVTGCGATYQTMHVVECFDDVQALGLVPREGNRITEVVFLGVFFVERDGVGRSVDGFPCCV